MITQECLKSILYYNENTGEFTWLCNNKSKKVKECIAGCIHHSGYKVIKINKKLYPAHRLVWLYVYGNLPQNQIDHINGIRNDNRIENLRDFTIRENGQNRVEHRKGKLVGVTYNKEHKKWRSQIQISGQRYHLGYYSTEIEAHNAYLAKLDTLTIDY